MHITMFSIFPGGGGGEQVLMSKEAPGLCSANGQHFIGSQANLCCYSISDFNIGLEFFPASGFIRRSVNRNPVINI